MKISCWLSQARFHYTNCVSLTADSRCKQQEAQVHLLEKEIQLQRHRGSQQRGNLTSRDSSTANTSLRVLQSTTTSCQTLTNKQSMCFNIMDDQLSSRNQRQGEGSEKENMTLPQTSKKKELDSAPISFLEDVERELEKQNSARCQVRGGGTDITRNVPKVMHSCDSICINQPLGAFYLY